MSPKFAFIILSVFFAFNISSAVKYKSTGKKVDMRVASDALVAAFSSGKFEQNHNSISDYEFTESEQTHLRGLSGNVTSVVILEMLREAFAEDIVAMVIDGSIWNDQNDPAINSVKEMIKWYSQKFTECDSKLHIIHYLEDYQKGSQKLKELREFIIEQLTRILSSKNEISPDELDTWVSPHCKQKAEIMKSLSACRAANINNPNSNWRNLIFQILKDHGEFLDFEIGTSVPVRSKSKKNNNNNSRTDSFFKSNNSAVAHLKRWKWTYCTICALIVAIGSIVFYSIPSKTSKPQTDLYDENSFV